MTDHVAAPARRRIVLAGLVGNVIVIGSALVAFGAIPLFHLIHTTDPMTIVVGELGFVLAVGIMSGGINVANVELMPAPVRCTGLAFAYNASIGCFGGTTLLTAATGNPIMPAYWIAAAATVTLVTALFLIPETHHQPLNRPIRKPGNGRTGRHQSDRSDG
jgi:MHS family proline/betaine transporter-like MFS transporter